MAAWGDFLSRYGSRGPSEIDINKPRWYEDPLPVLRVIAEFLNSDEGRHRTLHQSLVRGTGGSNPETYATLREPVYLASFVSA